MRVRSVTYTRQRKKKHFRAAKGAYATKKSRWRMVKQHLRKVRESAQVGRRDKKNEYRRLWIVRINAAAREFGNITYSQFMNGLKKSNVTMDRKILAEMAVSDPKGFTELTALAKQSLAA
jgi:large subunit ribosomal protein L20